MSTTSRRTSRAVSVGAHCARPWLLSLSFLVSVAPVASETAEAQNVPSAAAAEAVVRTAFAELDSLRWAGAAALVHPQTLARFRASQLEQARSQERYQNEPRVPDPDMPAAVVAWFEEQRRKQEEEQKKHGSMLSYQFAGIDSLKQLEALSAEEMFARHLQASDPRELLKLQMRAQGKDIPAAALSEFEAIFQPQRTVIGAAIEDDSTVHVVYRTRFRAGPERETGGVAIVAVRRTTDGWRIWTGSHDSALFDNYSGFNVIGFSTEEEVQAQLRELANRVVTWPLERGGEGRAFVIGYTGGTEPPQGLAIELHRPNARVVRVEIPPKVFGRLAELLYGWPQAERK